MNPQRSTAQPIDSTATHENAGQLQAPHHDLSKPRAVPDRPRGNFTQIDNAFILDPSIPNDAKLLLFVLYAEARGGTIVRLSQRDIRDRTNMPPERQDVALEWIVERNLIDLLPKPGAKPAFILKPLLLREWQPHDDWPRAVETRAPRAPVGNARKLMLERQNRNAAAPLLEPSADSGNHQESPRNPAPSASSGSSALNRPRSAESKSGNLPVIADGPSAGSGSFERILKKKTVTNTSSRRADDVRTHQSVDDACDLLRGAGVNVHPHEVGINRLTSRRLSSVDLAEWLEALPGLSGLRNPGGYVAKAIRLGTTFSEDRSRIAGVVRSRKQAANRRAQSESAQTAQLAEDARRAQDLDREIADLPASRLRELERKALGLHSVHMGRDVSPSVFESVLRSGVHALMSGKASATSGEFSYIGCRNEARVNEIRSAQV